MKFLTFSMYKKGHGGFYRHRRMARALINAGHDVVWISPDINTDIGEQFLPLREYFDWIPGPIGWVLKVRANLLFYRDHLYDVDAVFTTKEYDAFGCTLDKCVGRLPHIFFTHGDTINCEKFLAKYSLKFSRRLKSRIMLMYYPWLQRRILKKFSHVVVQADFLANVLKERHPNVNCNYIVLTSDCVFDWRAENIDSNHYQKIIALKNEKKFVVAVVAQVFYKAKGFDVFLAAMTKLRKHPNIHAVIIGYGEEADIIPKEIENLGLKNTVSFLGESPGARALMPLFDVVAAPTRFF